MLTRPFLIIVLEARTEVLSSNLMTMALQTVAAGYLTNDVSPATPVIRS